MLRPTIAITLLLVVSSVAGCLGGGDDEVKIPPPDLDTDSDGNETGLGPLDAPSWSVGQWWGHHTHRGPDDTTGSHFNVVVVEAGPSGYTVASQSADHARMDAEDDVFDLGAFGTDLSTTRGGEPWTWYDWPLVDNKTWTQSLNVAGASHDLTITATEADDLPSPQGEQSGYRITGTTDDGTVMIRYDYQPGMKWFSDLDLYDPAAPETPIFKIRNMGFGENKTGDYVQISLAPVVSETYSTEVQPVTDTFEVPEGATSLTGTATVVIDLGQASLTLTDPDGNAHEYTVELPGGEETFAIDIPDPPSGEWSVTLLGLGPEASAVLELTSVVKTVSSL